MPEPATLRTERLILRPWRSEDREAFAALNADPDVMKWFPKTLTRSESDAQADRIEQMLQDQGWGLWAVEVVESAQRSQRTTQPRARLTPWPAPPNIPLRR